ncbi:MAG: tRNA lysidine(34) synthetase TilS [Daejeonella sp.]
MIILNRFISFIKQHALFAPQDRVLLAVSGGRDSVLMAHLFNEAGFNFGIAHCNFNLRGEDSQKDEEFTSELAGSLDAPFFAASFDVTGHSSQHHISIQMAARDLRYQWLEEIRSDFDYQYIAMAHHQNDVIETMLLNLTRGTGIAGLHGILPKKNKIIRPLLSFSRDEINLAVDRERLSYREDSSNKSTKYARNKIRLEVIPLLKELNPSLEETFEANRKRFAELEVLLNKKVSELREKLFRILDNNEYEIDLSALKALEPLDTLLYELLHPYGFNESVLNDLKNSWDGMPGKVFSSGSHTLNLDRGKLLLIPKRKSLPEDTRINPGDTLISWDNKKYRLASVLINEFKLRAQPGIAQVDQGLLKFPLTMRTWNMGDRFQPLGVKGQKKISDFFIEQKIPLSRKRNIGILENGNGDVIWIAGLRIDDRYKITANTKKVFIFEQFT